MRGENEIGLVLSGGGAKGAFQIGVLQAMKEEGLLPYVTAVSGTSAGALNAALLLNSNMDIDKIAKIWLDFTLLNFLGLPTIPKKKKSLNLSLNSTTQNETDSYKRNHSQDLLTTLYSEENLKNFSEKKSGNSSIRNYFLSQCNSLIGGVASQKVISKLIYENIHISDTFSNDIDCYITCFHDFKDLKKSTKSEHCTETFLINGKSGDIYHDNIEWTPGHVHNVLLASIALPIYAPVNINGELYSDGGWESFFSSKLSKIGVGNIPYNVLLENEYNNLIIVNFDKTAIPYIHQKNIIEIKPPDKYLKRFVNPLELANFTEKNIKDLILTGKAETHKTLMRFKDIVTTIRNTSPPKKETKNVKWNKSFIYTELDDLVEAIQNNKTEIRFKNKSSMINKAISQIFSYNNSELPAGIPLGLCMDPFVVFYKTWGKRMADQIRKYDCYPTPESDCVVLYLNKI